MDLQPNTGKERKINTALGTMQKGDVVCVLCVQLSIHTAAQQTQRQGSFWINTPGGANQSPQPGDDRSEVGPGDWHNTKGKRKCEKLSYFFRGGNRQRGGVCGGNW